MQQFWELGQDNKPKHFSVFNILRTLFSLTHPTVLKLNQILLCIILSLDDKHWPCTQSLSQTPQAIGNVLPGNWQFHQAICIKCHCSWSLLPWSIKKVAYNPWLHSHQIWRHYSPPCALLRPHFVDIISLDLDRPASRLELWLVDTSKLFPTGNFVDS